MRLSFCSVAHLWRGRLAAGRTDPCAFIQNINASPIRLHQNATLSADRHLMMKDVVRVIPPLHLLQKWVKIPGAVVHLWPERIREHVAVWIVNVATLVVFVGVRSTRILRLHFLRVKFRIEL